jgi:hypothetical protein
MTRVEFYGDGGRNVLDAWNNFGAEIRPIDKGEAGKVICDVTAPDKAAGIGILRLASAGGIGDPRLILVDDLPTAMEAGANKSARDAQKIELPAGIEGACDELTSDFFRFRASKGQRLSFELVSARLGLRMDGVLRLLDSDGKELVFCEDDPAVGIDPRFTHTFAAAGEYVLEVRDVNHEGGASYRYRLRIGDFPLLASTFPMAVRRGNKETVQLVGKHLLAPMSVEVMAPAAGEVIWTLVRGKAADGFVSVLASSLEEAVHDEVAGSKLKIAMPGAANGRFDSPGDRDQLSFEARKGQRLGFSAMTRSRGSPCDVVLQITDAHGKKLTESNPADDESRLFWMCHENGEYGLTASELNGRSGAEMVYRIVSEMEPARFTLSTEVEKVYGRAGGTVEVKITCVRRDFKGRIDLEVQGFGEAVRLENARIGEGKTETNLKIKLPETLPNGKIQLFRIVGRGSDEDAKSSAAVQTRPALKRLWPLLLYPPTDLVDSLALFIKPMD